jgi:hypothetical protein
MADRKLRCPMRFCELLPFRLTRAEETDNREQNNDILIAKVNEHIDFDHKKWYRGVTCTTCSEWIPVDEHLEARPADLARVQHHFDTQCWQPPPPPLGTLRCPIARCTATRPSKDGMWEHLVRQHAGDPQNRIKGYNCPYCVRWSHLAHELLHQNSFAEHTDTCSPPAPPTEFVSDSA